MSNERAPGFRVPYHIGVATHNIDEAIERLAPQLGLAWETPRHREVQVLLPSGTIVSSWFRVAHSRGLMSVELLQGEPGSIWYSNELATLHHYAYRTADFGGDLSRLETEGWQRVASMPDASGGPSVFAYLRREGYPMIELVAQ